MSSDTIHNIVTLVTDEENIGQLIEAFDKFSRHVQAHEPETLLYYSVQPKGQNQLVIIEKRRYTNEEAWKTHVQSEAFKGFSKALAGILKSPPDIKTSIFSSGFETRSRM
ncbi:uncharacterized protein N7469_002480 [Penicillium citrinum]|uniref:ABM domain-containing protein n=2 Tax=Penicillium TaxID=5073 RepID=A0A9W9PAD8_PENCI|nr:uncharacterized protein N7469_002480 [Penicillium citrinum]KAJ5240889.1 hypothetical protein N7469_002480 [Penicillium citrinum]KAJ5585886.1 hypothetical protein N7450_005673 [Penicillium hetheringtonii]